MTQFTLKDKNPAGLCRLFKGAPIAPELSQSQTRHDAWVDLATGNPIQTVSQNGSVKLSVNGSAVRIVEFRQAAK